jgi:hypothetical protein
MPGITRTSKDGRYYAALSSMIAGADVLSRVDVQLSYWVKSGYNSVMRKEMTCGADVIAGKDNVFWALDVSIPREVQRALEEVTYNGARPHIHFEWDMPNFTVYVPLSQSNIVRNNKEAASDMGKSWVLRTLVDGESKDALSATASESTIYLTHLPIGAEELAAFVVRKGYLRKCDVSIEKC